MSVSFRVFVAFVLLPDLPKRDGADMDCGTDRDPDSSGSSTSSSGIDIDIGIDISGSSTSSSGIDIDIDIDIDISRSSTDGTVVSGIGASVVAAGVVTISPGTLIDMLILIDISGMGTSVLSIGASVVSGEAVVSGAEVAAIVVMIGTLEGQNSGCASVVPS